jgi:hypothetical protein
MMKISVKLVALHLQLSILTGKFKLQNQVSFCINLFIKMVFTLEQDIFIGMAYFRTGNFDAANGWQYSTEHGRCISLISTNVLRTGCYFSCV